MLIFCITFQCMRYVLICYQGCTSHMAAEVTWALLSKIILCVNSPIMDPSGYTGKEINDNAIIYYLMIVVRLPVVIFNERLANSRL